MKSPFIISFKKTIKNVSNEAILENFKINFNRTYCDSIEILDNKKLLVKNELFRWKPDMNLNLWIGIGSAKILIEVDEIQGEKIVYYSIDFTRLTTIYLFTILFFSLTLNISSFFFFYEPLIVISSLAILIHVIAFIRHWSIFIRTIKHGTNYYGNYKWDTIFERKSDNELKEIVNGKGHLPNHIIEIAKKEFDRRKL